MESDARLVFDFETRSKSDLKKEGAFKYSLHPSTQPTCLSVTTYDECRAFLKFHEINQNWEDVDPKFRNFWEKKLRQNYLFCAHNAFFERCIYNNIMVRRYGWPKIPALLYRCTAAKAAACALPRNLEGAGEALNLSTQKDRGGYIAMMATCKPKKAWKKWNELQVRLAAGDKLSAKNLAIAQGLEPEVFLEPESAPEVFDRLYYYCQKDSDTEMLLDKSLPDLIAPEQEIWHLNQRLNWRGLRVDTQTIEKIVGIMAVESKTKLKELDSLTMGLVTKPNARKSIFDFLEIEGVKLPNLRAETVDDTLSGFNLSDATRALLELRKALSMTSTKKYQSFLNRASNRRVRDILMYHGASTGRDTGVGIQPQNFPRGIIKVSKDRPYAAVKNVVDCDKETLNILYGESLSMLFSSIIRNMILPSEGFELFVGDYAKIEVAVLWWLADNFPGLKILRAGLDPYIYQAAANTGKNYTDFTDESPDRQLGKAQVLGCGFGMGADKFQETAAKPPYRLKLTDAQAKFAVQSYRNTNPTVPLLWKTYENAAIAAVESGTPVRAGKCKFFMKDKFLWAELPSGRRLAYREPQITWRETEYGPRKTLEFHAVNSKTKKWGLERTWGGTLTENIVQAVARDLMMPAMVKLEKAGYRALLTVHDEAICERQIGEGSLEEFTKIMCEIPPWGEGLPIEAKAWKGPRYRK